MIQPSFSRTGGYARLAGWLGVSIADAAIASGALNSDYSSAHALLSGFKDLASRSSLYREVEARFFVWVRTGRSGAVGNCGLQWRIRAG